MEKKIERFGSISGLAMFFLGIGLLCLTFFLAYSAFADPSGLVRFEGLIPISGDEFAKALKVLAYFVAIGLLWVMGSVAGRIATHGMRMFRSKSEST